MKKRAWSYERTAMGVDNTRADIYATQDKISSLEDDLSRLKVAKNRAQPLTDAINRYRDNVDAHNNSIDRAGGSFSWEGQTVKDFKKLYDQAASHLNSDVVKRYTDVENDLEDKIAQIQQSLSYYEGELRQLNRTLDTLLAAP